MMTLKSVCAVVVAALLSLVAPLTTAAEDYETTEPAPIPWFDEPAPFCGSVLNVDDGVACSDHFGFFDLNDGYACPPGLSDARYDGRRYVYTDYAHVIANFQEFEDTAFWHKWCVRTVTVEAPAPVLSSCPAGYVASGTYNGNLICDITPAAPAIAAPVFTG